MSYTIQIIAGLGNPGEKYEKTLHNAGFWFLENLALKYGGIFRYEKKFDIDSCKVDINGCSIWLIKPQSFMNLSGRPIKSFLDYYQLKVNNLLVVQDEIDLPSGTIRLKEGGGHGGHNGLRDIDRHLGLAYWRVRIGIGRPPYEPSDGKTWVLADFGRDEQSGWVPDLLNAITDEIDRVCQHDDSGFMSRVAYLAPAPSTQ